YYHSLLLNCICYQRFADVHGRDTHEVCFIMSTAARFPSSPRRWRFVSPSLLPVPLLAVLSLIACGGGGVSGGGGGGGGSGNPPDFSLVIGVPNLSVQQQGAYQFQSVAAKPVNGFTG